MRGQRNVKKGFFLGGGGFFIYFALFFVFLRLKGIRENRDLRSKRACFQEKGPFLNDIREI